MDLEKNCSKNAEAGLLVSRYGIEVRLRTRQGSYRSLRYQLFDTPFIRRWLPHFQIKISEGPQTAALYGPSFAEPAALITEINQAIEFVNLHQPGSISSRVTDPFDRKNLTRIHDQFERLHGEYVNRAGLEAVFAALERINIAIHRLESLSLATNHRGYVIAKFGAEQRIALSDSDYLEFSAEHRFGWLYLAYDTLGIATEFAFRDRIEHQPTPQRTYSAALELSFDLDRKFSEWEAFHDWCVSKGLSAWDPKVALGQIPLGMLIEPEPRPETVLPLLQGVYAWDHACLYEIGKVSSPAVRVGG